MQVFSWAIPGHGVVCAEYGEPVTLPEAISQRTTASLGKVSLYPQSDGRAWGSAMIRVDLSNE